MWLRELNRVTASVVVAMILLLTQQHGMASVPPYRPSNQLTEGVDRYVPYLLQSNRAATQRGINAPSRLPRLHSGERNLSMVQSVNAIALFIQFPDKNAVVNPGAFDSLLFASSGQSLRAYYREVSYGSLDIVTIDFPGARAWTTSTEAASYYANGQSGFGAYPTNAQKLAEEAIIVADSMIDFSNYDNDGDGYIDALYIIHAGTGGELSGQANDIWSHTWSTSAPLFVDGVHATSYAMVPEYWLNPGDMTCGVLAHETGHLLFGLPDLYDLDGDSHGLGRWSVMSSGSWNGVLGDSPSHPDAWSRWMMNFVEPNNIVSGSLNTRIRSVEQSPTIFRLWTGGANGTEYYLVENRQKVGFDSQLRGEGLCIYHIDEVQAGNRNQWYPGYETSGHSKVALVQADNLWNLEQKQNSGDGGDLFPGSTGNTQFSSLAFPGSIAYSGDITQVTIRNISPSGNTMMADFHVDTLPRAILSTSQVHFDTVQLGMRTDRILSIRNLGLSNLSISSIHSSTSELNTIPGTVSIPPDSAVDLGLSFTATMLGAREERLVLSYNGSPNFDTLSIRGYVIDSLFQVIASSGDHGTILPSGANDIAAGDSITFTITPLEGWMVEQILLNDAPVGGVQSLTLSNIQSDLAIHVTFAPKPVYTRKRLKLLSPTSRQTFTVQDLGSTIPFVWTSFQPGNKEDARFRFSLHGNIGDTVITDIRDTILHLPLSMLLKFGSNFSWIVSDDQGRSSTSESFTISLSTDDAVPSGIQLAQNYPNPFNPTTTIHFKTSERSFTSLTIYDMSGREVARLVEGLTDPGDHAVLWKSEGNSSGIYFYILRSNEQTFSRQMVLMK